MEDLFNELNTNGDTWVNHDLIVLDSVHSLVGGFLCNPPLLGKKTTAKAIDHTYAVRLSPYSVDILMEGIDTISIASIEVQRINDKIQCFVSSEYPYFLPVPVKHPVYRTSTTLTYIQIIVSNNGLGLSLPLCWNDDHLSYTLFRSQQHDNRGILQRLRTHNRQYGYSNALLGDTGPGRTNYPSDAIRYSEFARSYHARTSSSPPIVTLSRFRAFNYQERPSLANPYELEEGLTFRQFSGIHCLMSVDDYGSLIKRGCFGVFRATNEGLIVDQYNFNNDDPFEGTKKVSGTWDHVPSEDYSTGVSLQTYFQTVKHKRSRIARRSLEQLTEEILSLPDVNTVTKLIGFSDQGLVLGLEYTNPITERNVRLLRIIRNQYPNISPRENHTSAPIEVIQEEPEEVEIESPIERRWYEAACRRGGGVIPSDNPKDWFTAYMNENIIQGNTMTQEDLDHYNTLE